MATEYCKNNNIELNAPIDSSNVALAEMQACPYNWPRNDECVEIRFAVSVSAKNKSRGYELKAGHLEQMWEHYEAQLKPYRFSIYRLPEYSETMIGWAVPMAIIILIIIIIIGILFSINYFKIKAFIENKKDNIEDDPDNGMNSTYDGMHPCKFQETGDIVENQVHERSFHYDNVVNLSDDSETEI
ncbi:PREDICTED: uncharacterized protein LOC108562601 [Nicrophorus vespilloides]|uniref:Uncharacterized protein LOC108562601 n=1 Tax=Nicrophorus vespilloides TaxID=110193 RepID=A0ABM1MPJ2_NICVS|nr:PREDICTED: uncharacterized protein LOC108562601 [Nicrophorus vespilloides]